MRKICEDIHQRVHHERTRKTRLQLATTRFEEAERKRIWALVAAQHVGLSMRNIAAATGLSRSRIHQRLQDSEGHDIPEWLTHLRDRERDANPRSRADTNWSGGVLAGGSTWSVGRGSEPLCVPTQMIVRNVRSVIMPGCCVFWLR